MGPRFPVGFGDSDWLLRWARQIVLTLEPRDRIACSRLIGRHCSAMAESVPVVPQKATKRARSQCFKASYTTQWPYMVEADNDEYVFCTVCDDSFSIAHGSGSDICRHVQSAKHRGHEKRVQSNKSITNFFSTTSTKRFKSDGRTVAVTSAEVMLCEIIVEHNLPLATADVLTKAVKLMCPDSHIATGMSLSCHNLPIF